MEDYLQGQDNDLLFDNGDLVRGESTSMHQKDLLIARKSDYKQKIQGVDITRSTLDDTDGELFGRIRREFANDGMTVNDITFDGVKLKIDGAYD